MGSRNWSHFLLATGDVTRVYITRLFSCFIATKNGENQKFACYGEMHRGLFGRIGDATRLYTVVDPVWIEEPIRINNGLRPKLLGEE